MSGVTDIFGYKRNPKPKGVFSSEDSLLTFGGENVGAGGNGSAAIGYLVQQWSAQYQQQVSELFEIGTNALYWSKGRPQGQGGIGRIIGAVDADSVSKRFFPDAAYDICKGGALVEIKAKSGNCDAVQALTSATKTLTIKMDGVVVTSIGFSMQVRDVLLNESLGWRFAAMEVV